MIQKLEVFGQSSSIFDATLITSYNEVIGTIGINNYDPMKSIFNRLREIHYRLNEGDFYDDYDRAVNDVNFLGDFIKEYGR